MENVSNICKIESIKSFESTIRKTEKALDQMVQKGSNTTLIKKRLKALQIGLAILESVWNRKSYDYTNEELVKGRNVLIGLLPSIEKIYAKSKEGSPQRTLLERRIKSLELAVQAIDDIYNERK